MAWSRRRRGRALALRVSHAHRDTETVERTETDKLTLRKEEWGEEEVDAEQRQNGTNV